MLHKTSLTPIPGPSFLKNACYSFSNRLFYSMHLVQNYGDLVKIPGFKPTYLVNHLDLIQHILQHHPEEYSKKGFALSRLEAVLGYGLLTSHGKAWSIRRKLIQPALHPTHLPASVPIINKVIQEWLEEIEEYAIKQIPFNLAKETMRVVLRSSGLALFHLDFDEHLDEILELINIGNQFASTSFWISPKVPLPHTLRFKRSKWRLKKILSAYISQQRKNPIETSLLTKLFQYKDPDTQETLTEEEIINDFKTLLVTGHETTGSALAWFWYCISKNVHSYDLIMKEINEQLGSRNPEYEDLKSLKYINMAFSETLRLYPPIWMIARTLQCTDSYKEYIFHKGSTFFISPYTLHRHPSYWKNPDEFYPERFDPSEKTQRVRYSYIPFGIGPRTCIAGTFALMHAPLIISQFLQKYRFELIDYPPVEPEAFVSLKPRYGVWVRIHKKDHR